MRASRRKKVFNLRRKKAIREEWKELKTLVTQGAMKEALKHLPEIYQAIDKALKRGLIKPSAAARRKSQAARSLNKKK